MVVIGGGIAGVSVAYELSGTHRVAVVEAEAHLAFHSTGRSAAMGRRDPCSSEPGSMTSRRTAGAPPVPGNLPDDGKRRSRRPGAGL